MPTAGASLWGIGGIAVAMALVAVAVCGRWLPAHRPLPSIAIGSWMAITAGAALSGRLARFDLACWSPSRSPVTSW